MSFIRIYQKEMSNEALTGSEKVAILLNFIGEEKVFDLLSRLSDGEVHHIFNALKTVEYVDEELSREVLREFCDVLENSSLELPFPL